MALALNDLPHYTYDDYIQWEGKWEIIYGIAYAMAPAPSFEHQSISQRIAGELYNALSDCEQCQAQLPVDWQITEETVVQPDNMVICEKIDSRKKLTQTPAIVFEILSHSTANKDRNIKYALYESAGVNYYVIVSPFSHTAEIYYLHNEKYKLEQEVEDKTFSFQLEKCSFQIDFSTILGPKSSRI